MIEWKRYQKIHFIGIGGIGMSALAHICHHQGMVVQGSDSGKSLNIKSLAEKGIKIYQGHDSSFVDASVQAVIVSSAIIPNNPEYKAAECLGIPIIHRSDCLRYLFQDDGIVAVSGTHGKTTSTALLGHCLKSAGIKPSLVVGGIMNNTGQNFFWGKDKIAVIEADESDKSHVQFDVLEQAIITNIGKDHMDTYQHCWDHLLASFCSFVRLSKGQVMVNFDDPGCRDLLQALTHQEKEKVMLYGTHPSCHIQLLSYQNKPEGVVFSCKTPDGIWSDIPLKMWGHHNVMNAMAVIGSALFFGLSKGEIYSGLSTFLGVDRRMTRVGFYKKIPVIDDYAVHPTEIKTVLKTLSQTGYSRILCIVQPHRYTRLRDTIDDLSMALTQASTSIILPVYAASEASISGGTSADLVQKMFSMQDCYLADQGRESFFQLICNLTEKKTFDVIVFMGAGDVTEWARDLVA